MVCKNVLNGLGCKWQVIQNCSEMARVEKDVERWFVME
jgi:hypothetical protein